jgi:DUF4097 and DUF4098 domain-containing protein YvlB
MWRALCLVLAAAALLPAPARSDDWNRSFPLTGRPLVRVRTDDGHVSITTWDRPEVVVRVHTTGWRIGSQVSVDGRQTGNTIDLEARTPHIEWGIFLSPRTLAVEVSMPREADLDVHSGDGGIELEAVSGRIVIETGDGHIRARGLRGEIRMHTGDGGIDGGELDGRLEASSGDGRLRVSGRFDALDLESGDGSVVAAALAGSTLGSGWSIRTGDGPVTLRLGEGLKAQLDAHTNDGSVTTDFPVEVSGEWGRSRLVGSINGGGPTLRVRTGDGSIRIQKL